jgi:hypothetical protein
MDSKECLRNAQDCLEQASRATTGETQTEFVKLAKAWMQLADEALRDKINLVPFKGTD